MSGSRLPLRMAQLAVSVALVAVVAACGGGKTYYDVVTNASEGSITGRVYTTDGMVAVGLPVTVSPPSVAAVATVVTGPDGRFSLRAPAGSATITCGNVSTTLATRAATVTANGTADVGTIVLTPREGSTAAGNAAPVITAATTSSANVVSGGTVTVSATITDGDTGLSDLRAYAYALAADGSLVGIVAMTNGATGWTAALTLTNPGTAPYGVTVYVTAADTPGSNLSASAAAGAVTVAAP